MDPIQQNMPFAQSYQQVDPSFSQWQLNPQDVVDEIEHSLWGDEYDHKKNVWNRNDKNKQLSDEGIKTILRRVKRVVNKIVIMSNLPEDVVKNWLWDISHWLSAVLFLNYKRWNIRFSDLQDIHDTVMQPVEAAYRRAVEDGERKKIYEAQRVSEIRTIDSTPKENRFSFIPGLGGR